MTWRTGRRAIAASSTFNTHSFERMGMYSCDIEGFDSIQPQTRTPRLTIRCEYPDGMEPTQVTFRISPTYGIHSAREAHDWFLRMMQEHEEFEVETDEAGAEAA